MFRLGVKVLVLAVLLSAGYSALSSPQASAAAVRAKDNCPNAPGSNWGNRGVDGAHIGAMATITVRAMDNKGTPINTSYTLSSSNSTGGNIFDYSKIGKGGARQPSKVFNTGEWLYGAASGKYRCNGYSQLGAGTVVKGIRIVGNGWIADCRDGGRSNKFKISNVDTPNGEMGVWKLYRINTNLPPSDPRYREEVDNNVNRQPTTPQVFDVDNGENMIMHLVWVPNDWKLEGSTNLNKKTVQPEEKVTWGHMVRNVKGDAAKYKWTIQQKKNNGGWSTVAENNVEGVNQGSKRPDWRKESFVVPKNAQNNDKWCQRITFTNKDGPLTGTGESSEECFTVSEPPDATPLGYSCRYVKAKSPGVYKPSGGVERSTRTVVKVNNVEVTEAAGTSYLDNTYTNIPSLSGVASENDNMTWDMYKGENTKFAAVPSDSGSKTQDERLWKFWPTKKKIRIIVVEQWHYPGGDNPDTPNKVETDFNKGWHNIATFDQELNCAQATCALKVEGSGPEREDGSKTVLAGDKATITATITNTSPGLGDQAKEVRLFDTSFTYNNKSSSSTGRIPPGATGDAELGDVPVPDTINNNWNINFTATDSKVTDLNVNCGISVPVYREFRVVPAASASFAPTDEKPTKLEYETSAQVTNGLKSDESINMSYKTCLYFLDQRPEREEDLCNGTNLKGSNSWNSTAFSKTRKTVLSGVLDPLSSLPVKADQIYCSVMELEYTNGYVGSDGNILEGWSDAMANPDQGCDYVNNKPYFKIYGSGAKAGGEFSDVSGSCNVGGTLAGWHDNTKIEGGVNRGTSSELSSLARVAITGVASAQTSGTRTPTELTFANNGSGVTIDPPARESSTMGGSLGGGSCLPKIDEPENVQNKGAASSDSMPGALSESRRYTPAPGGFLTVEGRKLSAGTNQSIFVVDGDVYINEDITYDTAGWNKDNIPSFVLKATGNIYIGANVQQLDGLYIAQGVRDGNAIKKGKIFTCSVISGINKLPSTEDMYDSCNKQLVVRGAFVAEQVNLMRTGGTLRNAGGNEHARPSETRTYTPPAQGPSCEIDGINQYGDGGYTSVPPAGMFAPSSRPVQVECRGATPLYISLNDYLDKKKGFTVGDKTCYWGGGLA